MDHDGSDRPEQKTALIARELARYKVQIAAQIMHPADKGSSTLRGRHGLHILLDRVQCV